MEPRKVAVGGLLLCVSSLTLIETGVVPASQPLYLAAAAWFAIAAWSMLADVRRQDRPA